MTRLVRKNRKGFTLVELLVVVLILAVLMAVALPLYLSSVADAGKKSCRANMQTISNAAQAWKVRTRAASFTALTLSDLNADLGATPQCPDSGTYSITTTGSVTDESGSVTIPSGGMAVTCSFAGHNSFVPGVSSR